MSMELHDKFASYLRSKTESLQWLQTVRAIDSATHSQKKSMVADFRCSLFKVLT